MAPQIGKPDSFSEEACAMPLEGLERDSLQAERAPATRIERDRVLGVSF
jgi:hypothetical protein